MLTGRALVTTIMFTLTGCGGMPVAASPGAKDVVVDKDAPPAGYVEVTTLKVQSGKGCELLGDSGSMEAAQAQLRNAAAAAHASYVQIIDKQVPHPNRECAEHEYKLTGVAYRNAAAAPVPSAAPAPSTQQPHATATVTRVCIPGATQACLGPGACAGAQACRDDASGFLPCDCGHPSPAP